MISGLILAAALSSAQSPEQMVSVYVAGDISCAKWLSAPSWDAYGKGWILGYWTASNVWLPTGHMVGSNSDTDAIIAEVRLVCTAEPSTNLMQASARVFTKFAHDHK